MPESKTIASIGIVCLAAFSPFLGAQVNTGRITGSVTDATGAVIGNAVLSATNTDTGVVTRSRSSDSGEFLIGFLVPGKYRVEAEKPGFQRYVETDVP